MTTYACPKGHASSTDDFCDECGAKIAGAPAADQAGSASSASVASTPTATPPPLPGTEHTTVLGDPCPNCGTPRSGGSRFCEDCGFDHSTGKMPDLAPPVQDSGTGTSGASGSSAGSGWTATIRADQEYFEANAIEGVDFPGEVPERLVSLPAPQVRIGRKSSSKGTNPEIDLSDFDPGASHSHALLTLSVDGVWLVSDLGSTNGTYLNDEQAPLTAGETKPLKDGDEVHVGAWTTITLHAPA